MNALEKRINIPNNIQFTIFCVLIIIFTSCYWSFFPGGYTFDSYISYLSSLGIINYYEVTSPILSVYWKIINNYNFAPFLINYLIFLTGLILSIKFTKRYTVAIFSLIGICLPYTLITYIFAWKDNALLTILFLITVMCLCKSKKSFYNVAIIFLFFLAFSLRLNAVFAIAPLIYCFLISRFSRLNSILLLIVLSFGFYLLNQGINKYIFRAEPASVSNSIMFTDIAKINYWQQKPVSEDIPEEFIVSSNTDSENVEKMFKVYYDFSCNDPLFMYPEWQGAKSFLKSSANEEAINRLKFNWLKKVSKNPVTYFRIRCHQLSNSLWSENLLYSPESITFNEKVFNTVAGSETATSNFDRESKIFYPPNNDFSIYIRNSLGTRSYLRNLLSYPGIFLILSVILFFIFWFNRRKNHFYQLGVFLTLSGVLYTAGYFPILPCTDFRYFIWTTFSFWVALGILILGVNTKFIDNNSQTIFGSTVETKIKRTN